MHARCLRWVGLSAAGALCLTPAVSEAHFVLQSPASMYEQAPNGDPQKAPPCGDNGGAVLTGDSTTFQAGDTVTITIDEAIYHPGHYRIALSETGPDGLPEPAPVTPGDTPCGSAPIMDPPVYPVLADGVFEHDAPFSEAQTIDITLPDDVSCENCTLQVIQFMSNHALNNPGGCYYHHCAEITIQEGPVPATTTNGDSGMDSSGGDAGTTDDGGATTASSVSASASAGDTNGGGDDAVGEDTTPATSVAGGSDSGAADDDDSGGCSCRSSGMPAGYAVLPLVGLLGLRRRRR